MNNCLTAVLILLLLTLPAAAQEAEFRDVQRVVAVGDVHGDFKRFVELLRSAGIIDAKNRWAGGRTHLVQTGDLVDRGSDSRLVMDLLMQLERQAQKAGGHVHVLLGNHEAMNLYGDLRYVSPGEYASFQSKLSEELREQAFQAYLKQVFNGSETENLDDMRRQWQEQRPLGWVEHRQAFGPKGKYGKWLRNKNTVIRINDILFVHAGISPKYASLPIREINERIRAELVDSSKLEEGLAIDPEGPLWYRGLSQKPESELVEQVDTLLHSYGVSRIVVGHSPTLNAVLPRVGGKVILIDVGLSGEYGGPVACLIIEGTRLTALHRGHKLDLPEDGQDIVRYLESAAMLDAAPTAPVE